MSDTLGAVRLNLRSRPYSTRKLRGWQEAGVTGLLLAVLTVVFFWAQLVRGQVLYWGDIGLYFLPMTSFLRENLRAGHLPLWNPLLLCGTPFVGNPQTWPAYPLSWLLPFVSAGRFLNLTAAVHVWLAGCGTFLFLRRAESLGVRASLIGAVVFAFGGQIVSKEQFPNMVQAIAWLPWILYGVYGVIARGRWIDAVRLGTALGLQLLAAHAQMTLLTLYLAVAYAVRQWLVSVERPRFQSLAARFSLAAALALGLCAVQVLPTLELYQNAWRQKLSFQVVNRFYLPPTQLANFILPTLHGHPYWGNFTARGNFWETCCYVGVLGFTLAVVGIVSARRGTAPSHLRFWAAVAVFGLWMATGGTGGVYRLAYTVFPGFHSFHDPARCLLWSAWSLSVLAAWGYKRCQSLLPRPGTQWVLFAICLMALFGDLAHFGRTLYPLASPGGLPRLALLPRADAAEFAAHQARVLSPDSARVWQRFTSHRAYRQDAPGYLPLWAATLTPNLPMLSAIPDAFGYEPLARRDAQSIAGTVTDDLRSNASPEQRQTSLVWAGMLGVRTVVFLRTRPPARVFSDIVPLSSQPTLPPLGKAQDQTRVYLCRNKRWQPRARLTTTFLAVRTRAAASALLSRAALDPSLLNLASTTLLVGQPGFVSHPGESVVAPIVESAPDKVVVLADTRAPALLVLADTLHPGWQADVDGQPAPILSADGFLRAVPLPVPGNHRVEWAYRPTSFLLGCYLSLLTVSAIAAVLTLRMTKHGVYSKGRQEFSSSTTNSDQL